MTTVPTRPDAGTRRDRALISIALAVIVALAWAYLVRLNRQMSSSMEYDVMMATMGMTTNMPWTAADVFSTFTMWAVMMIGMMAGTAAPTLFLFAAVRAGRGGRGGRGGRMAVLLFGLGYLAVWMGFSAGAALAQWALHQTTMLSPSMITSNRSVGGVILIVAGAYQWTPWKGACLTQCRHPLGLLMTNWRDGTFGPLDMGIRNGMYCVGCCWALMCVLFVVGVMSLFWVATLTGFVLLEKIGPAGAIVARAGGAVMVLAGLLLASSG